MEILAEQLEIVHRQWTEDEFSFAGRHYPLERCRAQPKPLQRPHPPLILGGAAGPRVAELAVRWADEYNTPFATVDDCRERRARIVEACERAGREPIVFSLMTACIVGRDPREVLDRIGRWLEVTGRDDDPAVLLGQEDKLVGTWTRCSERVLHRVLACSRVERPTAGAGARPKKEPHATQVPVRPRLDAARRDAARRRRLRRRQAGKLGRDDRGRGDD